MAFVSLSSTDCDAGSPLKEDLFQLIRTNLDDLDSRVNALSAISTNDIRDDFKGDVVDSTYWDLTSAGTPVVAGTIGGTYAHTTTQINDSNTDVVTMRSKDTKIRFNIAQERVVIMELRVRGVYVGANRGTVIGAQKVGIGNCAITDMIGIYPLNAGNWTVRMTNGGAGGDRAVDVVAVNAWHHFKFTITCSATAGNRNVAVELDGSPITGSPFSGNLPTSQMLFTVESVVNGAASSTETHCDYCLAYDQARPEAA